MRLRLLKLFFISVLLVLFAGCSLKYKINEPTVSAIKYDSGEKKPVTMKVVDQRTDTVFHKRMAGLQNVNVELENIESPVLWLSTALEKEFAARDLPLKVIDNSAQNPSDLVLAVKKYDIVSRRVSGFSPWESYHSFMGEVTSGGKNCTIRAYFFNGKVPVWSMSEIQDPCFNVPMSIIVKEIASKVNSCALNYSVSEERLKETKNRAEEKAKARSEDACLSALDLGGANNPTAMKTLITIADAEDRFVRACALSSIGTLGAQGELEFLKRKYAQYGEIDRFMALKSIGDIGSPEAIEFIRKAKEDPQYTGENGFKYCVDLYLEQ